MLSGVKGSSSLDHFVNAYYLILRIDITCKQGCCHDKGASVKSRGDV